MLAPGTKYVEETIVSPGLTVIFFGLVLQEPPVDQSKTPLNMVYSAPW